MIAKSYGYVYVAQVAMGASQAQYFNVIKEAEAYHGPSLSPRLNPKSGDFSGLGSQVHWTCSYATPLQSAEGREHRINQSNEVSNHGIKIGMGRTQNEEKSTSGTSTPPKKTPARTASTSTRRSPTGASSATSLWARSATTR